MFFICIKRIEKQKSEFFPAWRTNRLFCPCFHLGAKNRPMRARLLRELSVLTRSFPPILHKKIAAGVSLWQFFIFVYAKNSSVKTAEGICQGMAGGARRGKKPRNPLWIVRLFNKVGHCLTPLQTVNP